MFKMSGVHDHVTDAVMTALDDLQAATGVDYWREDEENDPGEFDRAGLAAMLAAAPLAIKPDNPPQSDVADLIAAALAHPDLPHATRNGILYAICELYTHDRMYENPEYLREIFKLNVPRGKKGGKR